MSRKWDMRSANGVLHRPGEMPHHFVLFENKRRFTTLCVHDSQSITGIDRLRDQLAGKHPNNSCLGVTVLHRCLPANDFVR